MKKVLAVCPKDENGVTTMEKAKCQNGDEIDYPFDLKHLFFVCHPTAVSTSMNNRTMNNKLEEYAKPLHS